MDRHLHLGHAALIHGFRPAATCAAGWSRSPVTDRSITSAPARRRPTPTDQVPEGAGRNRDPVADVADDHAELRIAVDTLGPKQRTAVIYRHLADLPYAEVAPR